MCYCFHFYYTFLFQVFAEMNLNVYDLSVDKLDVHAVSFITININEVSSLTSLAPTNQHT